MRSRISSRNLILQLIFLFLAGLLLVQFFFNRSLWNDEAMLALNIIRRNYLDLLRPLADHQIAPALFLLVEKAVTKIFGPSELALRLFPLLCGIASLVLIYKVCLALFNDRSVAVVSLCLLGLTPNFIYYSSELKQYAGDLMVLLAVYYGAFARGEKLERNRMLFLSVVGAIAIFLSNVSVVSLFAAGSLLLFEDLRRRRFSTAVPIFVWTVCFAINFAFFMKDHPTMSFMRNYWIDSFMPLSSLEQLFGKWAPKKISQVFFELLPSGPVKRFYVVTILLYVFGLVRMVMNCKFKLVYVCVVPVAVHLLMSAAKIYPFDLRLILYLSPLFIMVTAYGLCEAAGLLFVRWRTQYVLMAVVTISLSLALARAFPIKREELRPVLAEMSRQLEPGQSIYVYYGAAAVFRYYQETHLLNFGNARIVIGKMIRGKQPTWLTTSAMPQSFANYEKGMRN